MNRTTDRPCLALPEEPSAVHIFPHWIFLMKIPCKMLPNILSLLLVDGSAHKTRACCREKERTVVRAVPSPFLSFLLILLASSPKYNTLKSVPLITARSFLPFLPLIILICSFGDVSFYFILTRNTQSGFLVCI